ncbi:type II secretion system minor pseudopilin GspK [Sulfitobacter sabulilitoris]|uniref:Type II secretion system protein K n=1 Tax=Sulfitobacter sabulilitoris TaxID=2562655 RepID=A0A5S3PEC1_9RHOB|nr:type II secretion system minor pseudopilin GspK [Sulfitobacter sabulilitoris]TMM51309.1 general secretion pathway protein GspK [Sulfitobacter sabulilitoris]
MNAAPRDGAQGFVLVNALILVAALAAMAVLVLARAEAARERQAQAQTAAQLGLYLDSAEALAITRLARDQSGGSVDHTGEDWARPVSDVALDRGAVSATIDDLQGRFNINWLAQPEDDFAREGFDRLALHLGLAPGHVASITEFLRPGGAGGAGTQAAYARQSPALRPLGGPVLMLDQLQVVPGLRARDLARLRPFIAALPGDSLLNVNTASPQVLQAMMPGLTAAAADRMLQIRRRDAFASVEGFARALGAAAGVATVAALEPDLGRLSIGSDWFALRATATLQGHRRERYAVLSRQPLPKGVQVSYRVNRGE